MLAGSIRSWKNILTVLEKSWNFLSLKVWEPCSADHHLLRLKEWMMTVVYCAYFRCLDMLIGVLTSKHHFSSAFYNRMFDEIRQSRDALKPDSKSANMVVMLCLICLSVPFCSRNADIVFMPLPNVVWPYCFWPVHPCVHLCIPKYY